MSAQTEQESFSFQAEVVQILDLMVHSLYSNKEIFLRELISNASDAIDRLRLELLAKSELPEAEGPLRIRVSYDKDARTITVADNGVGMSRQEVIEHIGTIAKSGTREFLAALTGDQRQDASLIGQFGVGFYSAFIVADRVTLTTRRSGLTAADGVRWESDGRGAYTLETVEQPDRGTTIVLHLRAGEDDLLSDYRLRAIIKKYSDHISLPIVMPPEPKSGSEPAEGQEGPAEDAPVNQASALWARPKSELGEQDYKDFYQHVTGDFSEPLAWVHSKIEGTYEYTLLLFIPSRAPFDLWIPQAGRGIKLHIRRVFVQEDSGQLMPQYLRFVRGVIDSADLPLNVSRELLQGSRVVDNIRSNATKKVLRMLADIAEKEPEKYAAFWKEFGAVLKEGLPEDFGNRDEIARLLRFTSTKSASDEPDVSLADYVGRMKEGQQHIYYLLAPGLAAAKASPHLEAFRKKGIEVLLLGDGEGIDNWVVASLRDFDGKHLQSVAQGSGDLSELEDEAEAEAKQQASAELAGLVGQLKAALGERAYDVRVSSRLTTSPACIVANEAEIDINLARRLRGSGLPSQPVLEINPQHPLVRRLNREPADPHLAEWADVLFDQAVLTLGARITEPAAFVGRLNDLLVALSAEPPDADDRPVTPGRLLAVSDLHVSHPRNRQWVADLPPGSPGDWLLVAGDLAEKVEDIEWTLRTLRSCYGTVVWVPGNHDLWAHPRDPVKLRGEARYQHLVALCRDLGVITPEDPYPLWTGDGGPAVIVPLFLLYDYTFRPDGTSTKAEALDLAYRTGVIGADERHLHPDPYPSREAWCQARIDATLPRLAAINPDLPTILVSHFPLTREPTRILRYPVFAQWCGTEQTADWHRRFRALAVVYGHLHIPRTMFQDGVRFEEVSLGYPYEQDRHPERPRQLIQILPPRPCQDSRATTRRW